MTYNVTFIEKATVRRRVYAMVEAEDEKSAQSKVLDGNVDVIDTVDLYEDDSEILEIEDIYEDEE